MAFKKKPNLESLGVEAEKNLPESTTKKITWAFGEKRKRSVRLIQKFR